MDLNPSAGRKRLESGCHPPAETPGQGEDNLEAKEKYLRSSLPWFYVCACLEELRQIWVWSNNSSNLIGIALISSGEFWRPHFQNALQNVSRLWVDSKPKVPEPRDVQQMRTILLLWEQARTIPFIPNTPHLGGARSKVAFYLNSCILRTKGNEDW